MPAQIDTEEHDESEISSESAPLLIDPTRLQSRNKYAFAVGHVLNDICASLWFTYTLLFLHSVIGMPGAHAGAILLLGQIVDALATPLVGILADRPLSGKLAKYGRRKFVHLVGTLLVVVTFPFIFVPCFPCDVPISVPQRWTNSTTDQWSSVEVPWWQQMIFYSPFVILFQIGWAAVQIAHLSLIPELCSTNKGYTELTALRFSMSEVSTISVYFITWAVLRATRTNAMDQIQPQDTYKFRDIVLICVSIGVVFVVWFHIQLKEPPPRSAPVPQQQLDEQVDTTMENNTCNSRTTRRRKDRIIKTTLSFFRDPRLYQVAFLYVSGRLFNTLIEVFIPLYLDESLSKNAESLALVPLTMDIASFCASLFVKFLNENCGRVFSYLLGAMFCLLAILRIYFDIGQNAADIQIYLIAILLGCGSSITTVTSLSITADLIGSNSNSGATIYSAVTFTDKLLNGFVVMIIEGLKCESPAICPHYYRDTVMPVCGCTVVCGIIILAFYSKCRLDY